MNASKRQTMQVLYTWVTSTWNDILYNYTLIYTIQ